MAEPAQHGGAERTLQMLRKTVFPIFDKRD